MVTSPYGRKFLLCGTKNPKQIRSRRLQLLSGVGIHAHVLNAFHPVVCMQTASILQTTDRRLDGGHIADTA